MAVKVHVGFLSQWLRCLGKRPRPRQVSSLPVLVIPLALDWIRQTLVGSLNKFEFRSCLGLFLFGFAHVFVRVKLDGKFPMAFLYGSRIIVSRNAQNIVVTSDLPSHRDGTADRCQLKMQNAAQLEVDPPGIQASDQLQVRSSSTVQVKLIRLYRVRVQLVATAAVFAGTYAAQQPKTSIVFLQEAVPPPRDPEIVRTTLIKRSSAI